jgi:hypothetical protein
VFHNFRLEYDFQSKIDCLRQLHTLDITEDDRDILKTSEARFHEHLAESLLRLGFKINKMTLIYG